MAGRSRLRAHGFTLVELLVAVAALALLALMSWRGIDGMVRAQEQTRERSGQLTVLQVALGQWGTDLDAMLVLPHTLPLDWDGQVLRITRRHGTAPDAGAQVVAWTVRTVQGVDQWLRWQSAPVRTRSEWRTAWQQAAQWARTPSAADRRNEVALVPLVQWQLFYYRGGAWSNPLSSTGTEAPAPTEGGNPGAVARDAAARALPEGVRLQITLPPGQALTGQLTRDWVQPTLSGGRT